MDSLKPPDSHHLQAAIGWLELGNHLEADAELDRITAALRSHPDVLTLRWGIYSLEKKWQACFDVGVALVELAPDSPACWRNRSSPLHFMNRTGEAYELLLPALAKFPDDWTVHYDMACYAAVLGDYKRARVWLEMAFELGEKVQHGIAKVGQIIESKSVKQMALDDPDLERLWAEIGKV